MFGTINGISSHKPPPCFATKFQVIIGIPGPGKFWGVGDLKPFRNRYFQAYLGLKKRKIFRLRRALLLKKVYKRYKGLIYV